MAAGKFDLTVFLGSVEAEYSTQDLLHHRVDSLHKLATLTQDKLKEWNIISFLLPPAITKAQRLVRSSDAVVQEELLVSDTNLILVMRRKTGVCLSVLVGQVEKQDTSGKLEREWESETVDHVKVFSAARVCS